ncbi:MAG: ZIP family metal transporter [Fibromonadaceae bacterium]|jgi:ZIP family zinc transporter|nr:ZIP family metal transporter [Fibromonadaceae bacterium]
MIEIVLFSAIAGIFGTGLGGLVSAILFKKPSDTITCYMLSFAGGVMTSIVCFGLIPEAIKLSNIMVSIFGLILGIAIIMALSRVVDAITGLKDEELKVHHTHEELYHEGNIIHGNSKMFRSGILMFLAIGLHNIPEGLSIGAGGVHDYYLGMLLALMIALHNIPEGMAVASPLLAGGIKKWKAVLLTALSGASTFLGGLTGVFIGHISDFAIAMSLSAAGGAMLYVVFGEMIPQSIVMTKNRVTSIVTLFGIIIGLIVSQCSL